MIDELRTIAGGAAMSRATLLANHVIASEPAAVERLRPHAGRSVSLQFEGWPTLLPPLPAMAFAITPAGLLEWCGGADAPSSPDLRVSIDASNPALMAVRSLAGEKPRVEIAGDAALAASIQWLFDNLRWDVQDDLERLVGPGPARELARLGSTVGAALREAARKLTALATRGGDESTTAR